MSSEDTGQAPKRPARMTHNELKAMKAVQTQEANLSVQVTKTVKGFWSSLFTSLAFLLPTKMKSGCDINGHVFPKNWSGDFPRCTHCGKKIQSADEMGTRH